MSIPLLLLKIFLVPTLILFVTVSGRKCGVGVAGGLSAVPIVSGPILLAMSLEQGAVFAADAAQGTLLAVIASLAFGVTYSWASRWLGIMGSMGCALTVYGSFVLMLHAIHPSVLEALVSVVCALLIAPLLFPEEAETEAGFRTPSSDLPWCMLSGMVLVLAVTFAAAHLGPRLSGLLAMFPVMSAVLVGFAHAGMGRAFAVNLIRGMVAGHFAFATFCSILSILLQQLALVAAFACAFACALLIQLGIVWFPLLVARVPDTDRR